MPPPRVECGRFPGGELVTSFSSAPPPLPPFSVPPLHIRNSSKFGNGDRFGSNGMGLLGFGGTRFGDSLVRTL